MKHCILFPRIALNDPLKVDNLVFNSTANSDFIEDEYSSYIIDNLYSILENYFRYTKSNFTIACFESDESFDNVIKKYFPYLLIFRYGILHNWVPEYPDSEYIFLRFEQDDIVNNDVYINRNINGLQDIAAYIGRHEITIDERPPSSLHTYFDIEMACQVFTELKNNYKIDITNVLYLYIVANTPTKFLDTVLSTLIYVMGIERFLKLEEGKGKEEFGEKLKDIFKIPELKSWGKSVYNLRCNITHQHIDNVIYNSDLKQDYLWKSSDESIKHTSHYAIAKEILNQLIYNILNKEPFNKNKIREYLFCNELPIKRIIRRIKENHKFGNEYFNDFDMIKENDIGGTLPEKRRILRFLLEYLYLIYPDIPAFQFSSLKFKNASVLLDQFSNIRKNIDSILDEDIQKDDYYKLSHINKFIWKIQLPLIQEIRNAARTSHQ